MRYVKTIVFVCMFMALTLPLWAMAGSTSTQADLDRLSQEGTNAYYAADYQTTLQKWQAGLQQARSLDDKPYIIFMN